MKLLSVGFVCLLLIVGVTAFILRDRLGALVFAPRPLPANQAGSSLLSELLAQTSSPSISNGASSDNNDDTKSPDQSSNPVTTLDLRRPMTEVVAENLEIPWEIAFLPDESLLVTERPGSLVRIFPSDKKTITVSGVAHRGEGGLLGMALHPNFAENKYLYLYLTTTQGDKLINRVERYTFDQDANTLSDRTVILNDIPGAIYHDGGRLAFGPDKKLYITTGDAGQDTRAQDTQSLAGKILRVSDDGSIPTDNPFGNAVYSYGHRNPQGLAWDREWRLWSSEHGPSGWQTGYDEVNLIQAGKNYGWPTIKGDATADGMISPLIQSGSEDTWAPGDIEIVGDVVIFTGLRGQSLYLAQMQPNPNNLPLGVSLTNLTPLFSQDFGRLRAVTTSPHASQSEWLYFTTSNKDGRGTPQPGDDKIIRLKIR